MTLADEVAAESTRLHHLELKSEADDRLVALLKKQNAELSAELAEIKQAHDSEMQKLRQQRDIAERKATEVSGIIETLGSLSLAGINKMRGEQPAETTDRPPPQIVKHLQTAERTLPRPTLMDQARS